MEHHCVATQMSSGASWRALCQSLSDSLEALNGQPADAAAAEQFLQAVRRRLAASEDCEESSAADIVGQFLATGVLERIVDSMEALDFEAKKEVARLFSDVVRLCAQRPAAPERALTEHLRGRPKILASLLDGCGKATIFSQCADMLRSCARLPGLVALLLESGAACRLVSLAQVEDFDVASEAFACLHELLLTQARKSVEYLKGAFHEFFALYHKMLENSGYVTQRQALKLLCELLLNTSFTAIMLEYVGNDNFLQVHMKLLLSTSNKIQLDAFHIFKLFVASPTKPRAVQLILYKNKDRLLDLLDTFVTYREDDERFMQDLQTVAQLIEELSPPPQKKRCLRIEQSLELSRPYMDHRLLLAAP